MKVKELIELLKKQDQEKEIIIRFAVSEKDEIGYVLKPFGTANVMDRPVIYAGYDTTQKDCDFVGQFDLATLWENEYKERYGSNE